MMNSSVLEGGRSPEKHAQHVRALCEVAGITPPPRGTDIAFAVGPRINAAENLIGQLRALLPGFDTLIATRYVENPRAVSPENGQNGLMVREGQHSVADDLAGLVAFAGHQQDIAGSEHANSNQDRHHGAAGDGPSGHQDESQDGSPEYPPDSHEVFREGCSVYVADG